MHYFLVLILYLCCTTASLVHGKTIRIGPGEKISTISIAVSLAQRGDTILVMPGTYREGNIIIRKSVSIIGKDFPVLDGENKYEILTIHADNVLVQGLKFIDTGVASINDLAAIKVLDSKHVTIEGNQFLSAFFGIYLANSSWCTVKKNSLQGPDAAVEQQVGNGIHIWKCHHMKVSGNHIKAHRDGIYFEFVTNSVIDENISEQNLRYGLHFMFSHNDEYRRNSFLKNGAGVAVMYTKGVIMEENLFEHNWGPASYGLLLKDIRDSFVRRNEFRSNSIGIFMEGSSRISFADNTFARNGYAVKLQASCDDNTFSRNNFISNTFDLATNGSLVLNTINQNYWDRYDGYDLDRDTVGDVPYRPVSMYSMVVERMPTAVLLWRSFLVFLLDKSEKAIPAITPENLKDDRPQMKPYDHHFRIK
jgi:nitrous oxidase accessory protein